MQCMFNTITREAQKTKRENTIGGMIEISGIEGTTGSVTGTTHRAEVTEDNKLAVYATGSNGAPLITTISGVSATEDNKFPVYATGSNGTPVDVDVIASLPAGTNYMGNVRLTDGITDVDVNPAARAVYTSRAQHSRIARSLEFCGCHRYLAVSDDASVYLLGKVGADKNAHGDFKVSCEGKVYIELYEAPTITADGTPVTILSVNRQTLGTPASTLFHTPTIEADGTELNCSMVGTAGVAHGAGGTTAARCYFLFKKSQNYLLKVTNKKGGNADINVSYSWHEE